MQFLFFFSLLFKNLNKAIKKKKNLALVVSVLLNYLRVSDSSLPVAATLFISSGFFLSERVPPLSSWYLPHSCCVIMPSSSLKTCQQEWASLVAQRVECLPAVQEAQVRSLGREDHWRREWLPTPPRSLVAYSLRGHRESDTTERFSQEWVSCSD